MATVLVAGRYEVRRPLGHGAMAVVDLAHDAELDRPVALKRLAENLARDEDRRRRFVREARLAARLTHPNVVRVYDVGEDEGRPFIAMEYVDGETLADLVAHRGPLPSAEAVTLGIQAARALAAAHDAGLVHRDVKPHNLLLRRDGTLKLGDFGVAFGPEGTRLTLVGTVLGTAAYLAPEQARGEEVTAAADIYGLGAVLYELLTGRPPRTVSSLGELGDRSSYAVPDVQTQARGIPPELADVVMSCLAYEPAERPASAAAVARRLAAVSADAQTLPLPDDPARRATEILAPRDREPASRRRIPKLALAGVLAACALAGGIVAAVLADGGSAPPAAPSRPHVASVQLGTNAAAQARNLAAWLRRYSGG
jgi:eukaryotic-like serine/threonine-protein kinase